MYYLDLKTKLQKPINVHLDVQHTCIKKSLIYSTAECIGKKIASCSKMPLSQCQNILLNIHVINYGQLAMDASGMVYGMVTMLSRSTTLV